MLLSVPEHPASCPGPTEVSGSLGSARREGKGDWEKGDVFHQSKATDRRGTKPILSVFSYGK